MKTLVFAMIFASVFCFAEKKTEAQKHEERMSKLQRKLDKERTERARKTEEMVIKSQISSERYEAEQPRLKAIFALECPIGGEEQVIIHSALGPEFTYWRGGGAVGFLFRRYVMVHRAKNPYTNMTLNITTAGERVVSNMCPGGSITLVQSMPPFEGGYYKRVIWTAEGMVNGRLAYGYSSPGVLYQGWFNAEAVANRPPWVMNLDRVDRVF